MSGNDKRIGPSPELQGVLHAHYEFLRQRMKAWNNESSFVNWESVFNVKVPPRRNVNRKAARAAPKQIARWRNEWARIKSREADIYRRGNRSVGPR